MGGYQLCKMLQKPCVLTVEEREGVTRLNQMVGKDSFRVFLISDSVPFLLFGAGTGAARLPGPPLLDPKEYHNNQLQILNCHLYNVNVQGYINFLITHTYVCIFLLFHLKCLDSYNFCLGKKSQKELDFKKCKAKDVLSAQILKLLSDT